MMEDTRVRDRKATFSGVETFKQTTKNSFEKLTFSEDCDYFNRAGLQTSVDRHLENNLSHSMSRDNDEEVSFFKDYLKNDSGE